MLKKTLTAIDGEGRRITQSVEDWARVRKVTVKSLRQRMRLGFSDNDAVNFPKGKSPKTKAVIKEREGADKITQLWHKFLYQKHPTIGVV